MGVETGAGDFRSYRWISGYKAEAVAWHGREAVPVECEAYNTQTQCSQKS